MPSKNSRRAAITGLGSYVPARILTNSDLEKMVDTSDEWISTRTGIKERRIAAPEEATSDLCRVASIRAIADAGLKPEDIDLVLVATVTPDMAFPATACLVQDGIGAKSAAAFDLEAGCSGFLYGLAVASQFIENGVYNHVLIIGAETFSRIVNWEDRNTCVLFGDGAGACILSAVEGDWGVQSIYLGSDGGGGKFLTQPAGGSRLPASAETIRQRLHTIHMNGPEVFKSAVRIMAEASQTALEKCGLRPEAVDVFIPHQANIRIIEATASRLHLPMEKVVVNIHRYGNISSGSIPIAMDEAFRQGKIRQGDIVLLAAFGAGLTWGASVLKWFKQPPSNQV
ncbi:MAG: ketoacyl-ACP synthase III [Clostridia bacterium]|nr:ketoacyl-ACP synthase III [Clostridia bacterium]